MRLESECLVPSAHLPPSSNNLIIIFFLFYFLSYCRKMFIGGLSWQTSPGKSGCNLTLFTRLLFVLPSGCLCAPSLEVLYVRMEQQIIIYYSMSKRWRQSLKTVRLAVIELQHEIVTKAEQFIKIILIQLSSAQLSSVGSARPYSPQCCCSHIFSHLILLLCLVCPGTRPLPDNTEQWQWRW